MTNKETVNRNIGLSFDLIRQIIKYPDIINSMDNDSVIDFLQKDYPERIAPNNVVADHFIKVNRNFELLK